MVHLLLHYLPWLRAVGQAFAGLAEDGGFARAPDQRVLAPSDFFACTAISRNKKWLEAPIQRIKNNFKQKFRLELMMTRGYSMFLGLFSVFRLHYCHVSCSV